MNNLGTNVMSFADFFNNKQNEQAATAAHNLAWMFTKLTAPLVISDLLEKGRELDDEAVYNLHDMISDFEVDTALLGIAASALQVVRSRPFNSTAAHLLGMECERILCEYGDDWVSEYQGFGSNENYVLDVLDKMPEDFGLLSDLIQMIADTLEENDPARQILDILDIQSGAHSDIAEEFIEALETDRLTEQVEITPTSTATAQPPQKQADNVVPFPGAA